MSALTLAIAGDVMLGRLVAEALGERGPRSVWGDVLPVVRAADLFLLNLECALTREDTPWRDGEEKAFYFRADPSAVAALTEARVAFASVANNHVLDFGERGLVETLETLDGAGIAHAGAGRDEGEAGASAVLTAAGTRIAVVCFGDHPEAWSAGPRRAGINYTPVSPEARTFARVARSLEAARGVADLVVLSIHWGPNMRAFPTAVFRDFAHMAMDAGADAFWGHSAHVVQGIELHRRGPILYDTGDLIDDYAVDPELRNDLSALFLLRVADHRVVDVELLPVTIRDRRAMVARGADRDWFVRALSERTAPLGTGLESAGAHVRVRPRTLSKA